MGPQKSELVCILLLVMMLPHRSLRFTIDGRIVVRYNNGDIKETATDGTITYYYFETGATQIMFVPTCLSVPPAPSIIPCCRLNGLKVISFANKQMEKHYPDGTKEIVFPNKVRKTIHPDGRQQIFE